MNSASVTALSPIGHSSGGGYPSSLDSQDISSNSTPATSYIIVSNSSNDSIRNVTVLPDMGRNEGWAVIEVAILATIFFLAVAGNGVVVALLMLKRGKLSRMHLMMLHLSLADLSVAFFQVLPQMAWDITFRFQGGAFLCGVVTYLQLVTMYGSSYVLLAMAFDRYMAICRPFQTHNWTSRHAHLLVLAAWVVALLFSLPQVFIFSLEEVGNGEYDCWADFDPPWTLTLYVTWSGVSLYVIPSLILAALYGRISFAVWKSSSMEEHLVPRYVPQYLSATETTPSSPAAIYRPSSNTLLRLNPNAAQSKPETSRPASSSSLNTHCTKTSLDRNRPVSAGPSPDGEPANTSRTLGPPSQNIIPDALHPGCNQAASLLKQADSETFNSTREKFQLEEHHTSLTSSQINLRKEGKPVSLTSSPVGLQPGIRQSSSMPSHAGSLTMSSGQRPCHNGDLVLSNAAVGSTAAPGKACKHGSLQGRGRRRGDGPQGISRAKMKTIKLTLTVVLVYMICWTPYYVAQFWSVYDKDVSYETMFFTLVLLLASVNSCTNPWIYMAFSDTLCNSLRARMRSLACCCFRCFRFRRNRGDQSAAGGESFATAHTLRSVGSFRSRTMNGDSML